MSTDVSVNELLALIGEQSVKLRLYETQLEAALGRIAELEAEQAPASISE